MKRTFIILTSIFYTSLGFSQNNQPASVQKEASSVVNTQPTINDTISGFIYWDLLKQNQHDTSSVFDVHNAPSPDMVGKPKYVISAFELGTALPTLYRKEGNSSENITNQPNN